MRYSVGTVDELPAQIRVGAEVQQAQRGQRCRGVDPAADEVPEDVEELVVVKTPAVELELDEEARQVVAGVGPPGGGELRRPSSIAGTSAMAVSYSSPPEAAITEWKRLA